MSAFPTAEIAHPIAQHGFPVPLILAATIAEFPADAR